VPGPNLSVGDTVDPVLRALAIIALVLLVLLLVIPIGMGMAMTGGCPECHPAGALGAFSLCLAVLASLMILVLGLRELAPATESSSRSLRLARSVERPPQPIAFA
jgi:hypothetical protein